VLAVLVDDADTDHSLADGGTGERLPEDVVGEPEQDEQPEPATGDIHSGVHGSFAAFGVATACHQPDHDREREEDDDRVEHERDEAPR